VAKTFLFRLIFGGTAPAFANDPEFTYISSSNRYWQRAIDKFYDKYCGLFEWHSSLVDQVNRNSGKLQIASGRIFQFQREWSRGERQYPRTKILNYPVQGLGADIMSLARVVACRRIKRMCPNTKFVATVHDSLLFDCPVEDVQKVVDILYDVWYNLPSLFEKTFGVVYDLPCRVEVQVGSTWGDMKDIKRSNT
jgi:DNA polymerase I-like protein with 3'-5' exonuclease and polymerase domains